MAFLRSGDRRARFVPTVEQLEVRAVVSPVPYSKVVRETYAAGAGHWRAAGEK